MSRWVDAEYCEDFFDRWESRVKNAEPVTIDVVQNTRTLLRDAPSIDIVRCKDCFYWTYDDLYDEHICGNSEWTGVGVKADDFCSRGERSSECI